MKHVIVVEDDPINAALFRALLERRSGCRVTLTESAEDAVRLAREGADLVVLDVSLKGSTYRDRVVSGVDVCRLLKSEPATAHLPVILATAHAMWGDQQRLLAESGADDYVSKPIVEHEAFAQQVRKWLHPEAA